MRKKATKDTKNSKSTNEIKIGSLGLRDRFWWFVVWWFFCLVGFLGFVCLFLRFLYVWGIFVLV